VVIATGVLPYAHLPAELAVLSPALVTQSTDHHQLAEFKGRRVAVVGVGQSALETAALLHESGADVQVIARIRALGWSAPIQD
jgi:cation diffusion facilitator CzcD-associated flavoprotein CzcO